MCIELFGENNIGSNYQILGLAPAAGSVLASVVLSASVYTFHEIPHTHLCCGQVCFQLTHAVTSLFALAGCVVSVGLWYRTKDFYALLNGGECSEGRGRGGGGSSYGKLSEEQH